MSAAESRMGAADAAQLEVLAEPLLDAAEAAQLLRVPKSTLYELVRSRHLPHVRIGRRGLRFTRLELARWVRENSFGS
jgi:excisionase family DNA binding protein